MCTALKFENYFGRTLDYDEDYQSKVTITPRNYPFHFLNGEVLQKHYAIIGMSVNQNYPLYYEAMNEKGLAVAGLNFPGNAYYYHKKEIDKKYVASYELIPYLLSKYKNVKEVKEVFNKIVISDQAFSELLPPASLHFMIADKDESIVLEQTNTGIHIYQNESGIMTNNPTYDIQTFNLNNYFNLTNENNEDAYCTGLGSIGLPGDVSSMSRFIRLNFNKKYALVDNEENNLSQFFHLLNSVNQIKGVNKINTKYEYTIYTSCMNLTKGYYYYTTYYNHQINNVDLFKENLDTTHLIEFELNNQEGIFHQNG